MAILHGKMKPKEKDEIMHRFKNGESGADVHARMSIFLQYLFRRILSNINKRLIIIDFFIRTH